MIEYLEGFISLVMATALGFLVLCVIDQRKELTLIETCALSYGIGLGLLVWEMLILQLAKVSFTLPNLLLPLTTLCLLLFFTMGKVKGAPEAALRGEKFKGAEIFFLSAITLELITVFFRVLLTPMEAHDAVADWALKAKAIFLSQGVPTGFLQNSNYRISHPDYPLLVPLAESYVYTFLGHWNDSVSKLIFPSFLLACLVLFYSVLRRISLGRLDSLILTFFLASIPHFSSYATNGYADIVVTFYFSTGFLYLYLWIREKKATFLALSAVLSALAGLTKNEGIVLCCINFSILLVALIPKNNAFSKKATWASLVAYASILFAVWLPWFVFKNSLHLSNDVLNKSALSAGLRWENFNRIKPILYEYRAQFLGLKNWNIVWILFFSALIFRFKQSFRSDLKYILLTIVSVFLVYTAVYLITPYDVVWHLRTSASRLFLHFLPLVIFFLARLYADECKANRQLAPAK